MSNKPERKNKKYNVSVFHTNAVENEFPVVVYRSRKNDYNANIDKYWLRWNGPEREENKEEQE